MERVAGKRDDRLNVEITCGDQQNDARRAQPLPALFQLGQPQATDVLVFAHAALSQCFELYGMKS